MYELFNVHVNKANENTYSPMVTLRIIKGTIFYATAAFLMAPSVRSTKEVWSLTDCNVYFKRWLEFHRILVKPNEWLKHRYISYYLLCKRNHDCLENSHYSLELLNYWEHEHWDLICIICMCIYKNDFFKTCVKKLPAPVTRRNRYMFQIHRQMNHLKAALNMKYFA